MNYENRKILVTGGASGIGLACTTAFLEHGGHVVIVDQNADQGELAQYALREKHQNVHFIQADVSDFEQCKKAYEESVSLIGEIDTLMNNAGISPKKDGLGVGVDAMDVAEWDRVVAVNLSGAFYFSKLVTPAMKKAQFGRVLSVSSVAGKAYLDVCAVHYSATKAALIGFTRHLAGELGPFGITVNAIAPGRIDTDMVAMAGEAANKRFVDQTPMRRLGEPREVADLCLYLASRKEASFITGQVVDVAGGWLMT
jgi:3-oxoacyl-[acyl-carrier protein] reductase